MQAVGGGGTSLSKTGAQVRQRLREDGSYDFDVGSGRRAYARVRGGACFGAIALGGARPATVRQLLQDASEGFFVRYSASASPAEAVGFAAELGRILNMNQEWRWLMGHIPKDFFALDANDKEDKKFTTADIG